MLSDGLSCYEEVCTLLRAARADGSFAADKVKFARWVKEYIECRILIDAAFACKNGNQHLLPEVKMAILDIQISECSGTLRGLVDCARQFGWLAEFELCVATCLGDPFMFE